MATQHLRTTDAAQASISSAATTRRPSLAKML